jgi:hypothetical protein
LDYEKGAAGTDLRGNDWGQHPHFGVEVYPRVQQKLHNLTSRHTELLRALEILREDYTLSVLSDGVVADTDIDQVVSPAARLGIHKTGRYETSRRNCWFRKFMDFYALSKASGTWVPSGSAYDPWVMGDDCFGHVPTDLRDAYKAACRDLGGDLKCFDTEFCGLEFYKSSFGTVTWRNTKTSQAKALVRHSFLVGSDREVESRQSLLREYRHTVTFAPLLAWVKALVTGTANVPLLAPKLKMVEPVKDPVSDKAPPAESTKPKRRKKRTGGGKTAADAARA